MRRIKLYDVLYHQRGALTGAVPAHNHSSGASGGVLSAVQRVDQDTQQLSGNQTTTPNIEELLHTSKSFDCLVGDWFVCEEHTETVSTPAVTAIEFRWGTTTPTIVEFVDDTANQIRRRRNLLSGQSIIESGSIRAHCILAGAAIFEFHFFNVSGAIIVAGLSGQTQMRIEQFRPTLAP